ncbi:MAG: CBS domain-containing protein, partial [Planctomycetes bacterium]|nr:CBS domain-containing protein [Planctomycetota bacterium]
IRQCIRHIIKFKANAVLVTNPDGKPQGVVSKTDIMGAFYAELPVDTRISDIMVGPPYVCSAEDTLETAIDQMQTLGIHQIYVQSMAGKYIEGQMAYSDIVGLLYRYCRRCIKSGRCAKVLADKGIPRLIAADVMTCNVTSCDGTLPITGVIEILSERKLGAILVTNKDDSSLGIVSKTDLLLAYIRGVRLAAPAHSIMNSPVTCCDADVLLSFAIQQMLLYDIQR